MGKHSASAWQHKGYGAVLLGEAERVAAEDYDLKKLLVISALGTKQYYMRFGYSRDGVYVSKSLPGSKLLILETKSFGAELAEHKFSKDSIVIFG